MTGAVLSSDHHVWVTSLCCRYVQLCFCDTPLCNTGGRWTAPSAQLLLLLPLAATRL